ncbi:MAG: XRE family transcriptional regulator [Bacteroidota bacterium]
MYFRSNIKFLRKRKNRTQDDVAVALDMKRSTLSGYENGVAQPGMEILIKFSRYYGVAIDTLLTINLEKLPESQLSELERGNDVYIRGSGIRVLATTVNIENEENIEMVPEKAKAGYATGFADPEYLKELPVYNLPFLSKQKKYRTFQLSGDSMFPIPDKSWVTGEFVQDWNNIVSGHAYIVFTIEDGIVFKIVENLLKDEGILRLYSLNPIYEPYDVPANDIREVWQFVHYISAEIPDPVMPQDELIKTVASLKKDMDSMKKRWMKEKG